MFKKFKDKLAEEVKSSPQRIQQFAQAAQAAVTSASSSISDITNNDLFSIGDSDNSTKTQLPSSQLNTTPNLNESVVQSSSDFTDLPIDIEDRQRQRRLSNSSFTSDISFRMPNYESPSMYHLQSDMEVSASEAEEKFFIGNVNLDRVTKEQLYAAYRRTQERWKKYKTQYSDLARHYKLLERENAKARNVLVETQDKALRRISELKEQCTLEQSAKAHLEKALRVELEEKTMKINALTSQLNHQQTDNVVNKSDVNDNSQMQLINLNDENEKEIAQTSEVVTLNNKIEKLEQLLSKYKESLKATKDKNANITTEIQKLNIELENKTKENNELQQNIEKLDESKQKIQELLNKIESLENLNNSLEFSKNKEISILETSLKNAQDEVMELQKKIKIFSKREEEYAISLAENKLSIHKELESKEAEIKALEDSLEAGRSEIETLEKTVKDHKNEILKLDGELSKLNNELNDVTATKTKFDNLIKEHESLKEKEKALESFKAKCEEDINCLHLQLKQETAEKLSVIDRNVYLEGRITQLIDENTKKRSQINKLEEEVALLKTNVDDLKMTLNQQEQNDTDSSILRLTEETNAWKLKCSSLESEIQEERVELGKLQSEIEKLLLNHTALQDQNIELGFNLEKLQSENVKLSKKIDKYKAIVLQLKEFKKGLSDIRGVIAFISNEVRSLNNQVINHWLLEVKEGIVEHYDSSYTKFHNLQEIECSLREQMKRITIDYENISKDKESLKNENEKLTLALRESDSKCLSLSEKLNNLTSNKEAIKSNLSMQCSSLEKENKALCDKIKVLEGQITDLKEDLKKSNELHKTCLEEVETLMKEKAIATEIKEVQDEKLKYISELENNVKITTQHNTELKTSKTEIEKLYNSLETEFNALRTTYFEKEGEYQALKNEAVNVKLELNDVLRNYSKMELELSEVNKNESNLKNIIESLKKDNNNLVLLKEDQEEKYKHIENELNEVRESYESKLRVIIDENNSLKLSYNEILTSFQFAESELIKLRQSYNEQEKKRGDLENVIIDLETKIISQSKVIEDQEKTISSNNKACDCDILKEDNRRLRSDIEGLQTYLTKISKENGDLNDKLREVLASSENSREYHQLQTEIQTGKDKIEELLRENSLLIEENLELKDQIQTQLNSTQNNSTNTKISNEKELKNINDKYQLLQEAKTNLELKVNELEQMNNSLNKAMDQNQNNYERLKLSNEKLQRKLDEALVSLRHLHALEENTELEYLRNILYEYLTGSGSHSLTLAKVLAAVVKFDESQTEQVLLKEKERQGFLHQLGII